MDAYYRQMYNEIDSIDAFYSEDSLWGSTPEANYNYGSTESGYYA